MTNKDSIQPTEKSTSISNSSNKHKGEPKMNTYRKTAIIVGVLFIIGTVAGVLAGPFIIGPALADPLVKFAANKNQIIIGALLTLVMGFSLSMVPVMLFPILKKHNEVLALGSVVFRGVLEAVMYIAIVINLLFLLVLSQEYVKAGAPEASYFQTLGALFLRADGYLGDILGIVFPIGALMIYYLLYQIKLIPRWLSAWGFLGAIPYLASFLLGMFGFELGILVLPLAVQEMVMAVWLIVKGFNPSAIVSEPA
jgi:hypothetical protein